MKTALDKKLEYEMTFDPLKDKIGMINKHLLSHEKEMLIYGLNGAKEARERLDKLACKKAMKSIFGFWGRHFSSFMCYPLSFKYKISKRCDPRIFEVFKKVESLGYPTYVIESRDFEIVTKTMTDDGRLIDICFYKHNSDFDM